MTGSLPPPADGPREPRVWWSPSMAASGRVGLIVEATDEQMANVDPWPGGRLPDDAVRLVPAPAVAVPAEASDTEKRRGCCEINARLCGDLVDKGYARCCPDCTHASTSGFDALTEARRYIIALAEERDTARSFYQFAARERDALAERAAAVHAIHQREVSVGYEDEAATCSYCREADENPTPWPCPTIAALEGTS